MKKLLILIICLFISFSVYSQSTTELKELKKDSEQLTVDLKLQLLKIELLELDKKLKELDEQEKKYKQDSIRLDSILLNRKK